MTSSQGPGRSCLFCGRRPVSVEHVFPQWMSEWFKAQQGTKSFTYTATMYGVRKSRIIDVTSRRFCAPCNNFWMKRMEDKAAPILIRMMPGNPTHLTPAEQATLATWSFKTVLTFLSTFREGVRPPDSVYREFRQTEKPLAPVWLGVMEPNPNLALRFSCRAMVVGPAVEPPRPNEAWQTLMAFRRVFIGVIHNENPEMRIHFEMPLSTYRLIWPPKVFDIDWPPDVFINERDLIV